jgi:lipopolysaccharide export system protein LptC
MKRDRIWTVILIGIALTIFYLSYQLSNVPEETKVIQNYSDFRELKNNDKLDNYNLQVPFDYLGYSSLYLTKQNNYSGWYKYLCKGDTCILLFDESVDKSKDIDEQSPKIVKAYYAHDNLTKDHLKNEDSTKIFIGDGTNFVVLRLATDEIGQTKYGMLVIGLVIIGLLCLIAGLNKW